MVRWHVTGDPCRRARTRSIAWSWTRTRPQSSSPTPPVRCATATSAHVRCSTPIDVAGQRLPGLFTASDHPRAEAYLASLIRTGVGASMFFTGEVRTAAGPTRFVHVYGRALHDAQGPSDLSAQPVGQMPTDQAGGCDG